jgi:hypothetical protein
MQMDLEAFLHRQATVVVSEVHLASWVASVIDTSEAEMKPASNSGTKETWRPPSSGNDATWTSSVPTNADHHRDDKQNKA